MKKILVSILILCFILFPSNVMAAGYISTSTKTLTIEIGSSKTFTIVSSNAVGDVTIKSENTSIATVNVGFWETGVVGEGVTKTGVITVKGVSIGTTKINLDVDGATFSGEGLGDKDQVIVVNVVEKKVDNRSKNNKLKSIGVEGHNLVKVNDNNYTLSVSNSVNSIKVMAEAEDSKAKVTGVGVYDLKVGENNITVTVTAENGTKNYIKIKVTRKDGYYLDDLDDLLNGDNNNIEIILNSNSKLNNEDIKNIKDSGKIVKFSYYNEDKKLAYSWIIDGGLIKQPIEMLTTMTNIPSDEKIYENVNYADGMYVNVGQEGDLPNGTKLSVNVSDKYNDGDTLNVYKYNGEKMELVSANLQVKDGKIEFNVLKGMDYFITKANLNVTKSDMTLGFNVYIIISIVEFVMIIILLCVLLIKKKNSKEVKTVYSEKLDRLFMTEDNIFPVQ